MHVTRTRRRTIIAMLSTLAMAAAVTSCDTPQLTSECPDPTTATTDEVVVGGQIVFFSTDDGKRSESEMDAQLRTANHLLDFSNQPIAQTGQDRNMGTIGGGTEWQNHSLSPTYPLATPVSQVTRSELISSGALSMAMIAQQGGQFATRDDWHGAWRAAIKFSTGRVDVLSNLTETRARRSLEQHFQAQDIGQLPTTPNARVANETAWDYCDFLLVSASSVAPHEVPRAWVSLFFNPEGGPTPRAQLWRGIGYTGDKLDMDVTSSGQANVDLNERFACGPPLSCGPSWANVSQSLSTTGGGQQPVYVIAKDTHATRDPLNDPRTPIPETCLYIGPGAQIRDLQQVTIRTREGTRTESWAGRIDVVEVYDDDPGDRGCQIAYQGW